MDAAVCRLPSGNSLRSFRPPGEPWRWRPQRKPAAAWSRVIVEMQTDLHSLETGEPVGTLQGYSSGSAFGVGAAGEETDIFVTNRHVVTLEEGEESGTMEVNGAPVYFERSITSYYVLLDNFAYNSQSFELDSSRAVPFRVIYVGAEDDADVAVLQTAEPVEGRFALALLEEEDSLQVGGRCKRAGLSGHLRQRHVRGLPSGHRGRRHLDRWGPCPGFLTACLSPAEEGLLSGHLIQSTATINAGNSGGPLVNDQGVVVGINTNTISSTDTSVSSAYYALQIRYAREALDSLEIPYDTDATQSQEPLASSPGRNCRLPAGGWFGRRWKPQQGVDCVPHPRGRGGSRRGGCGAGCRRPAEQEQPCPHPNQGDGGKHPLQGLPLSRFRGLRRMATAASASKGFPARWRASGSSCLPAAR